MGSRVKWKCHREIDLDIQFSRFAASAWGVGFSGMHGLHSWHNVLYFVETLVECDFQRKMGSQSDLYYIHNDGMVRLLVISILFKFGI